jgi:hypothetical protein
MQDLIYEDVKTVVTGYQARGASQDTILAALERMCREMRLVQDEPADSEDDVFENMPV